MIPQEKEAAVFQGLREAFGTETIDDICRMTKGLSTDLVLRIVVQGTPYLLRIMTHIDERNDPVRWFATMKAAAEAGLAPRVWYTSVEGGISITAFVHEAPLSIATAQARMPGVLRSLHALPPFPKTFNFLTMHKGLIWRFRQSNLLPHDEIEQAFAQYARICAVYPRLDSDMVSCHNDLKPENILFDGDRVWLVDWQAAFVNDRYFDLAIIANFVVNNQAEAERFLESYFGQPPDDYQQARFFLMRQALHLMYGAVFLLLGSSGKPPDLREDAPEFRGFHERIWAGEISLADNDLKVAYGRLHWARLLENVRQPRFDDALRIVAERHAGEDGLRLLLPVAP